MKNIQEIKRIKSLMGLNEGFIDESELKLYNRTLNIMLRDEFDWFMKVELTSLNVTQFYSDKFRLLPYGEMYVNKKKLQERGDDPWEYDLNIYDLLTGDYLNNHPFDQSSKSFMKFVKIFSEAYKYISASNLNVVLVDLKHITVFFISN